MEDLQNVRATPLMRATPIHVENITMVGFKFSGFVREEHGQPLFGVQFNPYIKNENIFATVGSNRVTIYKCCPTENIVIPLQGYCDTDVDENFYTCVWSYTVELNQCLLIVAGVKGIIRILETTTMSCSMCFTGHGNAINELKIHPCDPNILLSASKDYALRLWNIHSAVCIAIFGGLEGHRDEVLSADFSMDGKYILSAGMDHALKLWNVSEDEKLQTAIKKSYEYKKGATSSFKVVQVHFPAHSSRGIHRNYIDCVRWFGNLAMSKSCEDSITIWKPLISNDNKEFDILHRLDVPNCEIWYIRFTLDQKMEVLAVGNQVGKILIWDLTNNDQLIKSKPISLSHAKCISPVRQVTFNNNANILIGVCDNGCVWKWDRKN